MRIVNFAHGTFYMLGAFIGYSAARLSGSFWLALALAPLAVGGAVVALGIWQFLERTRLGLLIRATSQNAEMVHALGIDVNLVRSAVFGIGCGLAGAGGVLAAPLVTAPIGMAATMIIDAFVIVIIGGMGR